MMMKSIVFLSILFACLLCPPAVAKEGVLLGMPDPAVIQAADGSFYIFATGEGLPIYHSTNLVDWEKVGRVFETPVPEWAKKAVPETEGIWAPDIVKLNDTYFVYYSVSSFGSQRSVIGVAMNKTLDHNSPDYQWVDQGLVMESFPGQCDFNAIDPAAFQQEDGRAFMVWGSFWGGIKSIELNPETGKPLENPPQISAVASRPDHRTHAIEGAYMVHNKDYYYLFVSWDNCCDGAESTYKVMVGRSKHPLGPYVDFRGKPMVAGGGTLVLANHDHWRGPGHNSVLTTEKGSWIVHHTYDTFHLEDQRILQIRPIYWGADGWPVVGDPLSKANPMTTEKAVISPDEMVGSWRLSMDYGDEKIIDLLPGGRIANNKDAWWKVSGNEIMLFWPGKPPTDGSNPDRCVVEPSKNSFVGRDQAGVVIRGEKLNP